MNRCLYCYDELTNETDFHAKCSQSFFGSPIAPELPYTLDQMSVLAKGVVERSVSVPGVQPKLSMSVIEEAKQNSNKRLTVVGALGGNYIFKPPTAYFVDMPANEHVTMRIAEAFGINVVPSSLIRLQSGELAYITKRIDRTENSEKIHMLDMFQILEAFEKYKGSMEKIGKALGQYSVNPLLDKLFLFELTLFSFLTGNSDMHLKNFSMLNTEIGWVLSPAYDLLNVNLVMPDDKEELALTLGGKKKKLNRKLFNQFGLDLNLNEKQITGVYNRFSKRRDSLSEIINNSFLKEEQKDKYIEIVDSRFDIIY